MTGLARRTRAGLGAHEQGLVITTSDFGANAHEEAARSNPMPVALMNGEHLVSLRVEYGVGVRPTSHELIEIGQEEDGA